MVEQKKEIRHDMRVVLANLDKRWEAAAQHELGLELEKLFTTQPFGSIEHILGWVPCFPGEVDLAGFIAQMLRRDRHIYLPRIQGQGLMDFIEIGEEWGAQLEPGHRGILEPRPGSGQLFAPQVAETVAVLVPGLAFDAQGGRLGRGGGFYDRFLARPELQGALKIGVCWSMQVIHGTPTDRYDVAMDYICHERGWIQVGRE